MTSDVMQPVRDKLTAHWLTHMAKHQEYITDAIQRHFEDNPEDRETMGPVLRVELKRIKQLKENQ
jgi:hypothetical protein